MANELRVDDGGALAALGRRLRAEEGGAALRRELIAGLRAVVAPAVAEAKAGALSIKRAGSNAKSLSTHVKRQSSKPLAERKQYAGSESLGAAVARGIGAQVRTGARTAGVSVRARKTGMPRGFVNAPKRLNRRSWRHPVFGHGWVEQVGNPRFFDDPMQARAGEYRAACWECIESMQARLR